MYKALAVVFLVLFQISCSNEQVKNEIPKENIKIENETITKEKIEKKEVIVKPEIKEEILLKEKTYTCNIDIKDVVESYAKMYNLPIDDIKFKNKDFIIKSNSSICKYVDTRSDNIEYWFWDFYMDSTLVHIWWWFADTESKTCFYNSDFINITKWDIDANIYLDYSRECDNYAIWTNYKNIRFSIKDIEYKNQATEIAEKLENLLEWLELTQINN